MSALVLRLRGHASLEAQVLLIVIWTRKNNEMRLCSKMLRMSQCQYTNLEFSATLIENISFCEARIFTLPSFESSLLKVKGPVGSLMNWNIQDRNNCHPFVIQASCSQDFSRLTLDTLFNFWGTSLRYWRWSEFQKKTAQHFVIIRPYSSVWSWEGK